MANTTTSPNMNLPVPVVATDPGPDWASNINACLSAIDSHDHSTGKGVPVTPAGLSINADLPFSGNNLITARSVRFTSQASPLSGAGSDVGCIYESGVDLYFNDGSGNQVRITQGGSVTGASGTITGLPSGTASASYAAGTFTFQSSTNTPATMALGPLVLGAQVASPQTVTIQASASVPSSYALTLPLALPASTSLFKVDTSGNMGLVAETGTGGLVVLSLSPSITTPTIASPTFSGTPSGSITGASYNPTVTLSVGTGVGHNNFIYSRIGNVVTFSGQVTGTTGASSKCQWDMTLPVAVGSNFTGTGQVSGAAGVVTFTGGTQIIINGVFSPSGGTNARVIVQFSSGSGDVTANITGQYLVY